MGRHQGRWPMTTTAKLPSGTVWQEYFSCCEGTMEVSAGPGQCKHKLQSPSLPLLTWKEQNATTTSGTEFSFDLAFLLTCSKIMGMSVCLNSAMGLKKNFQEMKGGQRQYLLCLKALISNLLPYLQVILLKKGWCKNGAK